MTRIGSIAITAVLGVCCALPVLASVGVLSALAGLGLGSWLVTVAGIFLAVIGMIRWRRTRAVCPSPTASAGGAIPVDRSSNSSRRKS